MARKKDRLKVVLDTNILVANYLSTNPKSHNVLTVRLWRERKLQLIVSKEVTDEYVGVLAKLNISEPLVNNFLTSLRIGKIVTTVNLGKHFIDSRDPSDNCFLSTAAAGHAKYLVTNDADLLEIPERTRRKYKFRIVAPSVFLHDYFKLYR